MKKLERQLYKAIVTNNLYDIKEILKKGLNVNIVNNNMEKTTPLMLAARINNVAAIKLLLEFGADRELEDFIGRNAYVIAEKYKAGNALLALIGN